MVDRVDFQLYLGIEKDWNRRKKKKKGKKFYIYISPFLLNIKRAEKEEISWEVFSTSFFFLGLVTLVTPDATGEEGKSYIIKPILQRHGHY